MEIEDSKVLCDVDGVLANFVGAILKASGTHLKEEDINDWDMFSMMYPEHREKAFEVLKEKSFWRNLPILPHAQKQIELLKRKNNQIVYVTSPWANDTEGWQCDGWGYARTQWLREHFGASHKDIILAYSKHHVQGDYLIDDRYKNIKNWSDANPDGTAVLMTVPYNKDMYWPGYRVKITDSGWVFFKDEL